MNRTDLIRHLEAHDLPEGWSETTVGQVAEDISYGFTAKASSSETGPRYLRITDLQNGTVDWGSVPSCRIPKEKIQKYVLRRGDLVFARTGATTGKSFLVRSCPEAVFASYLIRVRPSSCVLPEFLAWFFQTASYWNQISENISGSAQPNCNATKLASLTLPVPPLDEQQRIVAKLEEVLGNVDACQKRLAKIPIFLKRFRQSVLAAACSGRLTANWRAEQNVVEDLEHSTIEEIAEYVGGFAYKSPTFIETGRHQVVRIGNVRPLVLNLTTSPIFIPENIASETPRFRLMPNDLVISMTGTKYKRDYGCAAMVRDSDGSLYLNQRVARLRCKEKVLPKFLLYWLQTDFFREFFFAGETGNVNQGNVGADGIREAPIDLPSLAEQQEIVRRVVALFELADKIEARYRKAHPEVDKLTQSILAKAFRGELVPTNADLARR